MGCVYDKRFMEKGDMVSLTFKLPWLYLIYANRNDAKSVSIVSLGCLHPIVKVQSAALHFFLDEENEEDSSEEEDEVCDQLLYIRQSLTLTIFRGQM